MKPYLKKQREESQNSLWASRRSGTIPPQRREQRTSWLRPATLERVFNVRACDLIDEFGLRKACTWNGKTRPVAHKNYRRVRNQITSIWECPRKTSKIFLDRLRTPCNSCTHYSLHKKTLEKQGLRANQLPGMDSNHEWLNQNQQCYHYTTGQSVYSLDEKGNRQLKSPNIT